MYFDTVFLDRDGVINAKAADDDYIRNWKQFRFLPGAGPAIGLLAAAGRRVVVVTNQRGIALGLVDEPALTEIHKRMRERLARYGGELAGIYHCPHDHGQCDCRKPGIGLLQRARAEQPAIDFRRSVLVGDSLSDLQCGAAAGCGVILVGSGPSAAKIAMQARQQGIEPLATAKSLLHAVVNHILRAPATLAA